MNSLHLVSLPIRLRALRKWAAGRGFRADEGCALHHLLSETFGKGALQPFRLMVAPGAADGSLYSYAQSDEADLREVAAECALPDALAVCDLPSLAVKAMPDKWKPGRRLAFDVRVRPVRRLLKAAAAFPKGAEVDAFLLETLRACPDGHAAENRLEREAVYRRWLEERLGEAAKLEQAKMVRYERCAILRGPETRQGPDVVWHGELTVLDSDKFAARLASGVGRHGAYGYGMLLLRPAR
ncbi:type I-E CRISPR-associated protein Cas6/Cse3/CasE [Rhodomicrobium sp. Az07]|uniref:type I-E CRISPR-associated protein Cas6/Cse3/CasE n=1 Tax=Rhodomicrobium sp. Az07 TaxID=2839034 RepID=UPI001BE889CC|nr:type I-E CRISPR-associated protein Cas6/Cse3/CasE [Rhodomicrobium sp. Az07]MBT3072120.1 type I-E CRISPR-associated protein Cas6/Cse3/CasE [Rhodomicrobium sp. Az07]